MKCPEYYTQYREIYYKSIDVVKKVRVLLDDETRFVNLEKCSNFANIGDVQDLHASNSWRYLKLVQQKTLQQKVKQCWKSYFSFRLFYCTKFLVNEKASMKFCLLSLVHV